ncbi:MAG: TonB-dependent receptor [Methylococcaceae bacterium]|nr:TonB-dependent receptor [Methylococcaceae bacterium]
MLPQNRYNFFLLCLLLGNSETSTAEEAEFNTAILDDEAAIFADIPSVYSASRHEQPITEAPASISVVTDDDIKKYGYRTLADVLNSLKGIFTTDSRAYQRVGVRGFNRPGDYNTRLLVLVDGHRTNENIVDYSAIGTEFLVDIDDIKRVELVRGPASSLYGSNAMFGVLNVITKRGRDIEGTGITGSVGTQGTYEGKARYGKKLDNGAEFYLSGSHYQSEGMNNLPINGMDNAINRDGDQAERGSAKFSYADFTSSANFVSRSKQIPVPVSGTALNDPRTRYIDQRAFFDLKYEHSYTDKVDIMARVYYDYYHFDGANGYQNPDALYKDMFYGQWVGTELQFGKKIANHYLTVGGEYRYNFQQSMRGYDESPAYIEYANTEITSGIWGIFIQDEYHILSNLVLNAGFRYDEYKFSGGAFSPKAALIYTPIEGTTLKFLYGQSFRAPSVFEQNYEFTDTWVSSKDLKSEKMSTYELVLAQKINDNMEVSVSPFFNQATNLTELTGIGTSIDPRVYSNTDNISTYGVELELLGQWANGWKTGMSYSFQHSEIKGDNSEPENSPQHLAKLNVIAPVWQDQVFAGMEMQYTSDRRTLSDSVPGYFVTNLTLFSQNFIEGLEFSATLYNVFGTVYSDPSSSILASDTVLQNGRLFRVKINYEF